MSLALEPSSGAMSVMQSLSLLPTGDGITQPAGIVLSPDSRHLLVSLRISNAILGLAVDPASGTMRQTGRWACEA